MIECELRRLWCWGCGVRYQAVPWARADAPYNRDFADVVAWLAQQMAKTPLAGLLRIAWDSVGRIVQRVVADHLDESRLSGLVAIGVDEISPAAAGSATCRASPTVGRAGSCGVPRAATPRPCRRSLTSSDPSHQDNAGGLDTLLKPPAEQSIEQLALLHEVQHANKPMFRAFLLNEELRLPAAQADARARAPRRLTRLGITFKTRPVRQARAHDPPPR